MKDVCRRCTAVEAVEELSEENKQMAAALGMIGSIVWNDHYTAESCRNTLRFLIDPPPEGLRAKK